jgi:ABC-type uncharacterized transport system permease subunit
MFLKVCVLTYLFLGAISFVFQKEFSSRLINFAALMGVGFLTGHVFSVEFTSLSPMVVFGVYLLVLAFIFSLLLSEISQSYGLMFIYNLIPVVGLIFLNYSKAPREYVFESIHSHLPIAAVTFVLLSFSFINGCLYLLADYQLKHKNFGFWFKRLPGLMVLQKQGFVFTLAGFFFLTLTLLSGFELFSQTGKTLNSVGLRGWITAFVWLLYAFYFHIRYAIGFVGRRLAVLTIVSFILQVVAVAVAYRHIG